MTMRERQGPPLTEADLEAVFAAARQAAPVPGPDLLARIAAEADRLAPGPAAAPVRARPALGDRLAGLVAALGGRIAVAGLVSATLAGFWVGFAAPAPLSGLAGAVWPDAAVVDSVELIPSLDQMLAEG